MGSVMEENSVNLSLATMLIPHFQSKFMISLSKCFFHAKCRNQGDDNSDDSIEGHGKSPDPIYHFLNTIVGMTAMVIGIKRLPTEST